MKRRQLVWYYGFERTCPERRVNLYSRVTETGKEYPFLSYRECQADARKNGARAEFHRSPENAKAALQLYGDRL
jgi:hypothetical protein